jgi:hypothetical protein
MKTKCQPRNNHAAFNVLLLELLWKNAGDLMPGGGSFSDTFVGPNKILREGLIPIDPMLSGEYKGIEYSSLITLGNLVPKKDHPEVANTVKHKSQTA